MQTVLITPVSQEKARANSGFHTVLQKKLGKPLRTKKHSNYSVYRNDIPVTECFALAVGNLIHEMTDLI